MFLRPKYSGNKKFDAACKKHMGTLFFLALLVQDIFEEVRDWSLERITNECLLKEDQIWVGCVPVQPDKLGQWLAQFDGMDVQDPRYLQLNGEFTSKYEGQLTFDIFTLVRLPVSGYVWLDLEAETDFRHSTDDFIRGQIHLARMLTAQRTHTYTSEDVKAAWPVVSVWITNQSPDYLANTVWIDSKSHLKSLYPSDEKERILARKEMLVQIFLGDPDKAPSRFLEYAGTVFSDRIKSEKDKISFMEKFPELISNSKFRKDVEYMCNLSIGAFSDTFDRAFDAAYSEAYGTAYDAAYDAVYDAVYDDAYDAAYGTVLNSIQEASAWLKKQGRVQDIIRMTEDRDFLAYILKEIKNEEKKSEGWLAGNRM